MRRTRNFLINTGIVFFSLVFSFLLVEAGLRLTGFQMKEAKLLCLDGRIGNVYCPNIEAPLDNMLGGRIVVRTNGEGMADREYPRAKPAGTTRIALLGDSVTSSLYTPTDQKFKALWEAALTRQLGRPVEIMNFAIDGSATWDQLQLFHLKARHFQPDYVILSFFWGNDVWNNLALRAKGRGGSPLLGEYPEPSGVRKLQVRHRATTRWLWNHSAAFQFVYVLRDTLRQNNEYKEAVAAAAAPAEAAAKAKATGNVEYDPGFAWQSEGWELTRQLIRKLDAETREAGARLIVFHMPMLDQVTKPKPLPYREFRAFLKENRIAGIDPFAAIEPLPMAEKTALYIGDRTHLTAKGHALMAAATLPALAAVIAAR